MAVEAESLVLEKSMEHLWLLVVVATMIVYPVVLIRAAAKGKRWALDALEALRYVGGDLMTTSAWRSLPPERRPEEPVRHAPDDAEEPGRLVA